MNASDSTRTADTCVVCGKDTTGGRGFMKLNVEGCPVPLCCPMCYKVYQEDPARYVAGQKIRDVMRDSGVEPRW